MFLINVGNIGLLWKFCSAVKVKPQVTQVPPPRCSLMFFAHFYFTFILKTENTSWLAESCVSRVALSGFAAADRDICPCPYQVATKPAVTRVERWRCLCGLIGVPVSSWLSSSASAQYSSASHIIVNTLWWQSSDPGACRQIKSTWLHRAQIPLRHAAQMFQGHGSN